MAQVRPARSFQDIQRSTTLTVHLCTPEQLTIKVPPDDVLKAALLQYARQQLTVKQRLERLGEEHGYWIK